MAEDEGQRMREWNILQAERMFDNQSGDELGRINNIKAILGYDDSILEALCEKKGINLQELRTKKIEKRDRVVLMSKFTPLPYAEKLMEETPFLFDNLQRLWRYNPKEGMWIDDAGLFIRSVLRKRLLGEDQQKRQYVEEIIDYIKGLCWREKDVEDMPKNLIAFQNIIYDLNKEEFVEFHQKYFLTSKIPIEIDSSKADFDMIDFFLEELVGREKKQVLYELMAYCLYRSYPYQKFFILYGDGNNGKSAFLKLLVNLLGFPNISSEKPQNLVSNRFAAANLHNKLANISPDVPYTELKDTSIIRELTGEDALTCEQKYKNSFKFFNYAKIIFSANELPQVKDKTYAFDRRIYIIMFDKKIKKPDPEIIDKITTKSQLSGLGLHLIKILVDMKKRGYAFTHNPPVDEMSQLYQELSNSLIKFLKERTIKETGGKIPDFELKQKFSDWCEDRGMRQWRVGEINGAMKDKYVDGRMNYDFFIKESQRFESKFVKCWEGLSWKKD